MKFKTDFITNSSSLSFIYVFAKLKKDNKKTNRIIHKHNLYDNVFYGIDFNKIFNENIISKIKRLRFKKPNNIIDDEQYILWSFLEYQEKYHDIELISVETDHYEINEIFDDLNTKYKNLYHDIIKKNGFINIQKEIGEVER